MTKKPTPILLDAPSVTSLGDIFSIAILLGQNTVKFFERLSEEARTCQNEDTAEVFDDLARRERARVLVVRDLATQTGSDVSIEVDGYWLEQELREGLASEIADNPYLMTPYRSLRLAAINKERVFEILSTLAANQNDDEIRHHAEALAQDELSEIAELRLRRRRASRSEVKTAIDKAGLSTPPIELENFNKTVETVHAIIRTMVLVVRSTWEAELNDYAEQALGGLLEDFKDFPDAKLEGADHEALEDRIIHENDNLFSALKSLLRELESTVDLFLAYAENTASENIVAAAQFKAERYVSRIAKIRDQLNLMVQV